MTEPVAHEIDDQKLPEGKTCADCKWIDYCVWLFTLNEDENHCDYSPSKFVDAEEKSSK